ncbi:MAG: hypothetical protein K0Q51_1493, partial [Rickettsiaceae bacterium]|nr:hypothetical protein [Rickettsiaceae bacterium]
KLDEAVTKEEGEGYNSGDYIKPGKEEVEAIVISKAIGMNYDILHSDQV